MGLSYYRWDIMAFNVHGTTEDKSNLGINSVR
jgi:hypothetical protein